MSNLSQQYRPQTFSSMKGQSSVATILETSVLRNRIAHAYLFAGPRGTGKTTAARIFAKAINCANRNNADACGMCQSCLDIAKGSSMNVIEIDAASYTGVDNIRDIRDEVVIPPVGAPYKIYIIDEAHMLSKSAFNALLKTLEEPPKHVVFILATTELRKIPETVRSRCQEFAFSRLSREHIAEKLTAIAKKEKITLSAATIDAIALSAEGGMRDAESLLSQIFSLAGDSGSVSQEDAESFLGISGRQDIPEFAIDLFTQESASVIKKLDVIIENGIDSEVFAKRLVVFLRAVLRRKLGAENKNESFSESEECATQTIIAATSASKLLSGIERIATIIPTMKTAFLPQLPLEIAVVKISTENEKLPSKNNPRNNESPSQKQENSTSSENSIPSTKKQEYHSTQIKKTKLPKTTSKTIIELSVIESIWPEFLEKAKSEGLSFSLLFSNVAVIRIENGDTLLLATQYTLHKDKINEQKTRLTAEDLLATLLGVSIKLVCVSDEECGYVRDKQTKTSTLKSNSSENETLAGALEVFGASA